MSRWVLSILCISLCFGCPVIWGSAHYVFDSPAQQTQFQSLLHELRCPVCQNQDLADSNAALAGDLRDEVYHLVITKHRDQEIMTYLTQRYGDFIVFQPPVHLYTAVLWFGPALLMFIGLGMWAMYGTRRVRHD